MSQQPARSMFTALRSRNYRIFAAGQTVSLVGTWMQSVGQSWLVYRLTGSEALLGTVAFCGQLPVFLLATFGGTLADRVDRRRVVIGTQAASMALALVLAGLTFSDRVQVGHVMLLAALLGVVNALDIPARQTLMVDLVDRADLMNAIALNSSMVNGARIVGPALAGLLVAAFGEAWCFLLNGLSFGAVLASLSRLRLPRRAAPASHAPALQQLTAGLRFVGRNRPVRDLLLLLAVVSLTGMPYVVLMPVFAEEVLGAGSAGMGILMAGSGVGALAAALALARRRDVKGLGRWAGRAALGFAVALLAFSASRSFPLSVALMVPAGFCMMTQMAAANTLLQTMTPDALRGRVMGVYSAVFMGMGPFGALAAGVVASRAGAPATLAGGALLCAAGALVFLRRLPSLRAEARRLIVAQQPAGGDPPQELTGGRPETADAEAEALAVSED